LVGGSRVRKHLFFLLFLLLFLFFLLFLFLLLFLLLFLFLFFLFHLSWDIGTSLVVVLRGVGLSSLLARALTEPLGQLGSGSLYPFFMFLFPVLFQDFRKQDDPSLNEGFCQD